MLGIDGKKYSIGLNMCDLMLRFRGEEEMLTLYFEKVNCERIYIGSYFCDIYFIKAITMFSKYVEQKALELGWKITLVIPIIREGNLDKVSKLITELLSSSADVFDEVVVNDIGMLNKIGIIRNQYDKSFSIIAGRLMVKNYRDFRYKEFRENETNIYFPEGCKDRITAVEVDIVANHLNYEEIPKHIAIHMHYPFTYVSCGMICEYAAINYPQNLVQQTTQDCRNACMYGYMTTLESETKMLHVGKAVFFESLTVKEQSREPERYVFWPLDERMEMNVGRRTS